MRAWQFQAAGAKRLGQALPDVKDRLAEIGFDPQISTPEDLAVHIKAELTAWARVVRRANIRID